MRNLGFILGLLLFNVFNTLSQTTIPAGEIKSTTWTKEGSPYLVQGRIIIPKGETLIINAGVEIQFKTDSKEKYFNSPMEVLLRPNSTERGFAIVSGALIAIGNENEPIKFKRIGNINNWGSIILNNSPDSKLNFCTFENSGIIKNIDGYVDGFGAISIYNCSPQISNIKTTKCDYGIHVDSYSSPDITNCEIAESNFSGILVKGKSNPIMKNCIITNSNIGISSADSKSIIINCNILFNKDYGIICNSETEINNCIIWGNKYAFSEESKNSVSFSVIQPQMNLNSNEKSQLLTQNNIIGTPIKYSNLSYDLKTNEKLALYININGQDTWIGAGEKQQLDTKIEESNYTSSINKKEEIKVDAKNNNLINEVDLNIPINNIQSDYRFALIIGNEDYTKYQTNLASEVNVDYAINDAEIFAKYCKNTLGVPDDNIFLLKNAIGTEMKREINKLAKMMMYTQGKAEVIFYYAGHGIPHETTKEAYLMPVDVSAQNIEDGVKLSWLYSKLNEYNAKYVLVFLDACFTGGARNQGLLAARGVTIKPKDDIITGNCVAFTSSSDIQSSLPYKDKQHGLFTYYLLKKLQETSGNITLGELSDYLYEKVALSSLKVNSKEQTPKTLVSPSMLDSWKEIKLNE